MTQLMVVSTKAWRTVSRGSRILLESTRQTPMKSVKTLAARKTRQWGSPVTASAMAGSAIASESVTSRTPTTKRTGRKSLTEPIGRLVSLGGCPALRPGRAS